MADAMLMGEIEATAGIDLSQINLESIRLPPGEDFGIISDDEDVLQEENLEFDTPPDAESALLQQVLSLTPEQLSLLPPDQRQQVIQLQQVLRRDQVQPS